MYIQTYLNHKQMHSYCTLYKSFASHCCLVKPLSLLVTFMLILEFKYFLLWFQEL